MSNPIKWQTVRNHWANVTLHHYQAYTKAQTVFPLKAKGNKFNPFIRFIFLVGNLTLGKPRGFLFHRPRNQRSSQAFLFPLSEGTVFYAKSRISNPPRSLLRDVL